MKRLIALTLATVVGATGIASAAAAKKTSGTAWVGVTHVEGTTLYVAGDLKDKLLGAARSSTSRRCAPASSPGRSTSRRRA